MNTEWEFPVSYGPKTYTLKATLEYDSAQVFRIRVHGLRSSILFETNYPLSRYPVFKGGITWKFLEGKMTESSPRSARLMFDIFKELEFILKEEYPQFG